MKRGWLYIALCFIECIIPTIQQADRAEVNPDRFCAVT